MAPPPLVPPKHHQLVLGAPADRDATAGGGTDGPDPSQEAHFPIRVDQALLLHGKEEREVQARGHRTQPAVPAPYPTLPARCRDLPRLLVPPLLVVVAHQVLHQRPGLRRLGDPVALAQGREAPLEVVKSLLYLALRLRTMRVHHADVQRLQDAPKLDLPFIRPQPLPAPGTRARHVAEVPMLIDIVGERPAPALDRLAHQAEMVPQPFLHL